MTKANASPVDILELENASTLDDLEKAYRKASRKYHPDLGGTKEQFQELNQAYEELKLRYTSFEDKLEQAVKNLIQVCPGKDVYAEICRKIKFDESRIHQAIKAYKKELQLVTRLLENFLKGPPVPFFELFAEQYKLNVHKAQHELNEAELTLRISQELKTLFKLEQEPQYNPNSNQMKAFYQLIDQMHHTER
jgi:septation ring formation regulator EzrA